MSRLLAFGLAAALSLTACGGDDAPTDATDAAAADASYSAAAGPNSTVVVDYEGRLQDGTVFDSGQRVDFPLQAVVPGFRDAIVGMSAGDTKTFDVSPEEGYGAAGQGPIPPNATLTFDVTVHEVR